MMIHWEEAGKWDLYQALVGRVEKLDVLQPFGLNRFRSRFWNRVTFFLSEFYLPLAALVRRDSYNIVISWSMRLGICYGILNRLAIKSARPKHIIYDFHINLTRNDPFYRFRINLLRIALPGIDFFYTTSEKEKEIYTKRFNIHPDQIAFYPMKPAAYLLEKEAYSKGGYLFSYGNSDRDYDTLIEAVRRLPFQTVIVSKTYQPMQPLPPRIVLIREKPWDELLALIGSSCMVILPLQSYWIAAGQTAMLETLALGRPLIVTSNMATIEYATDKQTALFFEAGDDGNLKKHIQFLMNNPVVAENMGRQARLSVSKNAERRLIVFLGVLDYLLKDC
ncbi:MAG: glycosyltransferase [Deltaproteobacteria bacterium]|nr:glycosyltransferase [Deltaproteobacteria bacterium]